MDTVTILCAGLTHTIRYMYFAVHLTLADKTICVYLFVIGILKQEVYYFLGMAKQNVLCGINFKNIYKLNGN